MIGKKALAERIRAFLDTYAGILPDFDASDYNPLYDDKYTSPDAHGLLSVAMLIEAGKQVKYMPNSSWGSGGYKPYTSNAGYQEHEAIMLEIKNLITENK